MTSNARFTELLNDIEPSPTTKSNSVSAHSSIKKALNADSEFSSTVERIFIGGSYKRDTAIRPRTKNGSTDRPDVDLYVVVDQFPYDVHPADLTDALFNALNRARDELGITKLERNRVSISVSMNKADLDVSILLERQSDSLYRIGNRKTGEWYETDPEEHTSWSSKQNKRLGGRFKPMVKLIKWVRRENRTQHKHPKSFGLEGFLVENMDGNETHYGQLFHDFCASFVEAYQLHRDMTLCPELADPAIDGGNLLAGVSGEAFAAYFDKIKKHRDDAAKALATDDDEKATKYWRRIFGARFPATKKASVSSTLRPATAMSPLTFGNTQAKPSSRPAKFA